jgi:hypothetical protein
MAINRLGIVSDAASARHNRHSTAEKKLAETIRKNKNIEVDFSEAPLVGSFRVDTGAAYAGASTTAHAMICDGEAFELSALGTQTILSPAWTSDGLNLALDQTDNDGCELNNGINSASKAAWVVGDQRIVAECTVSVADVSGTDDCAFGLRKAEARQANIDDYDEMAVLNVISGSIKAETILNGGATSTSAELATLADAGSVNLKLIVNMDGSVEFYIDDVQKSVAFSFDDGEVVVPFLFMLNSSDHAGNVIVSEWNVGKL